MRSAQASRELSCWGTWPGFVVSKKWTPSEFLLGVFPWISHSDLVFVTFPVALLLSCGSPWDVGAAGCCLARRQGSLLRGLWHRPGSQRGGSALSTGEEETAYSSAQERRLIFWGLWIPKSIRVSWEISAQIHAGILWKSFKIKYQKSMHCKTPSM